MVMMPTIIKMIMMMRQWKNKLQWLQLNSKWDGHVKLYRLRFDADANSVLTQMLTRKLKKTTAGESQWQGICLTFERRQQSLLAAELSQFSSGHRILQREQPGQRTYPPARTTQQKCCKIRKKYTNIGLHKIGCGILAQLLASPFGSFGVVLASIVNWGGKLAPRSMEQLDSCDMWPLVALWTLWMWTLWSVACGMWTLVACGKFCWNFLSFGLI